MFRAIVLTTKSYKNFLRYNVSFLSLLKLSGIFVHPILPLFKYFTLLANYTPVKPPNQYWQVHTIINDCIMIHNKKIITWSTAIMLSLIMSMAVIEFCTQCAIVEAEIDAAEYMAAVEAARCSTVAGTLEVLVDSCSKQDECPWSSRILIQPT